MVYSLKSLFVEENDSLNFSLQNYPSKILIGVDSLQKSSFERVHPPQHFFLEKPQLSDTDVTFEKFTELRENNSPDTHSKGARILGGNAVDLVFTRETVGFQPYRLK